MAYQQTGLREKAVGYLEKGVLLSVRDQMFLAGLGHGYGVAGRRREAGKVLDELHEVGTRGYLDPATWPSFMSVSATRIRRSSS